MSARTDPLDIDEARTMALEDDLSLGEECWYALRDAGVPNFADFLLVYIEVSGRAAFKHYWTRRYVYVPVPPARTARVARVAGATAKARQRKGPLGE